jgi:hypothetical protein
MERDLEKAVLDLVIGEIGSLGGTPATDVGILSVGGAATDRGDRHHQSCGRQCQPADSARDPGASSRRTQSAAWRDRHICPVKNHTAYRLRAMVIASQSRCTFLSKICTIGRDDEESILDLMPFGPSPASDISEAT